MGSGNKVEMFIAVCALISSMIAIYVGWDQGRIMRAQQHGSVFPVLQVEGFSTNSPTYSDLGIRVRNSGVGPALVESVVLEANGVPIDSFATLLADIPANYDITRAGLTGRALAPGDQLTPIELGWRRENISVEQIAELAGQAQTWDLKICYCSVFDKCWRTTGFGSARAKSVPSCPRSETDVFNNFTPTPSAPQASELSNQPPITD